MHKAVWVSRGDQSSGTKHAGKEGVQSSSLVVNAEVLKCSWKGKCTPGSRFRDLGFSEAGSRVRDRRESGIGLMESEEQQAERVHHHF